jgi:hypothetical protein
VRGVLHVREQRRPHTNKTGDVDVDVVVGFDDEIGLGPLLGGAEGGKDLGGEIGVCFDDWNLHNIIVPCPLLRDVLHALLLGPDDECHFHAVLHTHPTPSPLSPTPPPTCLPTTAYLARGAGPGASNLVAGLLVVTDGDDEDFEGPRAARSLIPKPATEGSAVIALAVG